MKIAITANCDKQEVRQLLPEVLQWLKSHGVGAYVEIEVAEQLNLGPQEFPRLHPQDFSEHVAMVISFGGDGTILSIARKIEAAEIPILGVKLGGMGFLAELTPDELFTSLPEILSGRFQVVERMVLAAKIDGEPGPKSFALNDFVIEKGASSRLIRVKTYIDDEFLNAYISDGLIISTPTGSTAYSLAAGGPILLPSMQAVIINPICPHSLGARPVVVPGDRRIKVTVESEGHAVYLSGDGQVAQELLPGKAVTIEKAAHAVRLVSYRHRSFYDVLRAKLNWGGDIRQNSQTETD